MTDETSTPSFPSLARRGKVVLQHTTGPLKGMYRITGDVNDGVPDPYPEFVAEVDMLSHVAPAGLVKVTPHYVLYREISGPDKQKHFHEGQK